MKRKKKRKKKTIAYLAAVSVMALMMTGCSSSSETSEQKNDKEAEIILTSADEPAAEGNKEETTEQIPEEETKAEVKETEALTQAVTENVSSGDTETKENVKSDSTESDTASSKPYEYPEDICEGAAVVENSDGSLTLTVDNGELSVDFPPEWKNHFIVTHSDTNPDGKSGNNYFVSSKTPTVEGGNYHVTILSLFKNDRFYVNAGVHPIGYSNGGYWHLYMRTDDVWNHENPKQVEEENIVYEKLSDFVLKSFRSRRDSGEMTREFPIPEKAFGHVSIGANSDKPYCGYSLESILSGGELENVWDVEDGWHVTATDAVYDSYNTYINCYDTDDGDKYGWISFWNLAFPDNIG